MVRILSIYRRTERVKHSNGKNRIRVRTFNICNYPYCISIWISKVGFLKSKYDPRIRSENSTQERKTICICIRSIRLYLIRFHRYPQLWWQWENNIQAGGHAPGLAHLDLTRGLGLIRAGWFVVLVAVGLDCLIFQPAISLCLPNGQPLHHPLLFSTGDDNGR
jgi:hypothetical protein